VTLLVASQRALDGAEYGSSLGGHLLVDALRRCVRGGMEFGARAVVVDAINDAAVAFYRHFGFHQLEGRRLWRRPSDIARGVGG
jgi:ribosomal protein S18 acetylase RimI-like enzyme